MMLITLHPQFALPGVAGDTPPSINGEILTYRGEDYDLSPLLDGCTVEASSPFSGFIKRIDGVVHVTLEYLVDDTAAAQQSTNIADYCFEVTDGMCPCPIKRKPLEVAEEESSDAGAD